jgi:hypothetical protein
LIEKRNLHLKLSDVLRKASYDKYISIEMKNLNDIKLVKETIIYTKEIFS